MPSLIERLTANPKQIFFVDGIGAWVSAFLLSMVLANFIPVFGMPLNILTVLALIPGFFAFYSFGCYFFVRDNWPPFLIGIAIANVLYCFLTLGLVLYHYEKLTYLGVVYFMFEMFLIVFLSVLEFQAGLKRIR